MQAILLPIVLQFVAARAEGDWGSPNLQNGGGGAREGGLSEWGRDKQGGGKLTALVSKDSALGEGGWGSLNLRKGEEGKENSELGEG